MIKQKPAVTTTQLFTMLIISRVILNLTYNPVTSSSGNMWDHILSLGISFLVNFLLMIPVYFIYNRDPKMTLADNSINYLGKFGVVLVLIYGVYYLFVCCYTLSLFNIFISNVMDPGLSIPVLSIAIILTSCYGAYKGIEGLARASSIIMFVIAVALVFLIIAIAKMIDPLNYTPFLYDGPEVMLNGALFSISRMSCIPAMAMLLPYAKGNVKKSMVIWNVLVHISLALFISVVVGTLGEYSKFHIFPIYAVTSIAEIGMFKRLDALYLGIFTTALFVKISIFLYTFSLATTKVFNKKIGKISIFIGGVFVAIIGIIFSNSENLTQFFYNTPFVLTFTIATSFVLPILILIVIHRKRRKDVDIEKHS